MRSGGATLVDPAAAILFFVLACWVLGLRGLVSSHTDTLLSGDAVSSARRKGVS